MNIGIIGAGNVGGTLGRRWANNGHTVLFATRKPGSPAMDSLLSQAGPTAKAGSVLDAVKASAVLLLAIPWNSAEQALHDCGDLSGKIVIDATNPIAPDYSGLALGTNTSGGELVAQWASNACVVKAFNTVGFNVMADPRFAEGSAAMFYCGDDAEAKKTVAELITELGFEALDAGPLAQSRVLEPYAFLWITLALKQGFGREFGFRLLRREARTAA